MTGTVQKIIITATSILLTAALNAQDMKSFRNPSKECGVKTWWFFGYERTDAEGIAADARSFRDARWGGVVYYDQNHASSPSPEADEGFSPQWWEHLESAAAEAQKAGLGFEMNISNGYVAGGAWIDPSHAMQRVTSAELHVSGGKMVETAPPPIEGKDGYVCDIALLAFPAPKDNMVRHFTGRYAASGKGRNGAMQAPGPRGEFSGMGWKKRDPVGMLQCSRDSLSWKDVVELAPMYSSQGTYPVRTEAFGATEAEYWRINYYGEERLKEWSVGPEALLDRWEELSGLQSDFAEPHATPGYGRAEVLDPSTIVDISAFMGDDGIIRWNAPEGDWTILRLAATITGAKSKHGRANLLGYECDKLSVEAAQLHWDSYMQKILDRLRSDGIDNVKGVCMDSHEGGGQNWTPLMLGEFASRRGYRLEPWLPLLAGYVVDSYEKSEEVLRDFRRTINDCITENYYGTLQKNASRNGLTFTAQAIGNALCMTGDAIAVKKAVEKPQGEFWSYQQAGAYDIKDCSSAAHLYGKPIAAAEAFTDAMYSDTPLTLARVANIAFSFGAQEFTICATPHIPDANPAGPYIAGREYAINRSNPIWDDLKPLWKSCARSIYMLRLGLAAPDVLVYLGDDIPMKTLTGRLPAGLDGLDWDACTGDALQTRLSVTQDGLITTPDGVRYKAIVIADDAFISSESAKVLEGMRASGASILKDASGITRPIEILDDAESFVHTRRSVNGNDLYFIANIADTAKELHFRLADGAKRTRIWRTADGTRKGLKPSAQGIFSLALSPGESVFVQEF